MSTPGRPCIFCGDEARLPQLMWPRWLLEGNLVRLVTPVKTSTSIGPESNPIAVASGVYSSVCGCVCRTCNTGWVAEVEDGAKALLVALARGEYDVEFDDNSPAALATWAVVKAILVAGAAGDPSFVSQSERDELRLSRRLPESTRVVLARHSGLRSGDHVHAMRVFREDAREVGAMQSQLGTDLITVLVTLVIGRLIVQVTLGRPPYAPAESPSDEVDTSDQVTIWPIDQTSNWPPEVAVDGGSFDRFSRFDGVD